MPELPEVETVVRGISPEIKGATAGEAWVDWVRVLDGLNLNEFNDLVRNQPIQDIFRRGKYICIVLGNGFLVVHLRMTGRLYVSENQRGDDKWVHFSLELQNQDRYLCFSDARKFGRVSYTQSLDYLEAKLGPEPLELKPADFKDIIKGSLRAVKTFILDQKHIAGVGNIYADESLYHARIHPETPVNALTSREKTRLGAEIQAALQRGLDHEGATIGWYRKPDGGKGESQDHFAAYGKTGSPCLRCGASIERIVVGQRGTHFCPKCQKYKPR